MGIDWRVTVFGVTILLLDVNCQQIQVERGYTDLNDRFTLGSKKPWEYQCNNKPPPWCSCYYRGTYASEENDQALCITRSCKFSPYSSKILTYFQ